MKKADKERYQKLAELGCICCRLFEGVFSPCDVHHINGRTKNGNQETIGLCYYHHREGSNCETHVSRHPWLSEFEDRYKTEAELLEITNDLLK
jgi:hypothetical protein